MTGMKLQIQQTRLHTRNTTFKVPPWKFGNIATVNCVVTPKETTDEVVS